MAVDNETHYDIRINVPGRDALEATLTTVGGKRVELTVWNEAPNPDFYIVKLIGSLDANPVEYAAVSFHPVRIP
jgi:hypothetical protein